MCYSSKLNFNMSYQTCLDLVQTCLDLNFEITEFPIYNIHSKFTVQEEAGVFWNRNILLALFTGDKY